MSASELAGKECVPCKGGVPPLNEQEVNKLLDKVDHWSVADNHHIYKSYKFPDFMSALESVNKIGEIAEQQEHHPDIYLSWGKVRVEIWTHKIDGLTESDFILAAKVDQQLSD